MTKEPKPEDPGDKARAWADQVYAHCAKCLMAHSIRALEHLVEQETGSHHRVMLIEAGPKRFLGRRAVAYIRPDATEILVDSQVGFEHQRRGIAHELAHILFAKLSAKGRLVQPRRDKMTEDACSVFETSLCKKHDAFYADPKNIAHLRFPSLQDGG